MSPTKRQPRSPKIRGKSQSQSSSPRRRVIDPDELEDDAAQAEAISQDHALTLFFRSPPGGADHAVVIAHTASGGDQIVEDRSTSEIAKNAAQHANAVASACSRWAQSEARQTRFRVTWQSGDRVLASHQLVCGDGDPTALDGTVDSFLSQQQRHSEVQHRLHHEGFSMVQDAWRQLLSGAMKRIEALERDNESLRERLRKAGDVEAEILAAQVASDLEQRVRTTDIVESRLLPIVQALVMKQLGGGGGDPARVEAMLREATGGDASKLRELLAPLTGAA